MRGWNYEVARNTVGDNNRIYCLINVFISRETETKYISQLNNCRLSL